MIKINYPNDAKTLECLYIKSLFSTKFGNGKNAKSVKKKFDELKKEYPYSFIFYDLTFQDIIFIKSEEMKCFINKIELRIIEQSKIEYIKIKNKNKFTYEVKNRLKKIFNYKKFQPEVITPFFTNNFNFKTCFYCNKDFIHNFKKVKEKKVSTFQLDHFYDKGTYPYLALSFYNLIPSCPTCNSSKVKGTQDCFSTCKAPNNDSFDFNEKVKFKIFLDSTCRDLNIKNKDNIDIPLKENHSNKYDKYIEVFKLNERYKVHKDIVLDMIQKAELYPTSRLKELENLTGIPYHQIKKDIFNLIDKDEDLSKKQFSKLIKDISEELELI